MQTRVFTYNVSKKRNMAFHFLELGISGAVLVLYIWLWANPVDFKILSGGVFLIVFGVLIFIRLIASPEKESETAILVSDVGIMVRTCTVTKAAGMIEWEDVEDVQLYKDMLEVKVKNPEKYAQRMKSFFVRYLFLTGLKGKVEVSLVGTEATYDELQQLLKSCAQEKNIRFKA